MIKSEYKTLVRALTSPCTTALESAVARCVAAQSYEVTLEHFLLGLLGDPASDFSRLIALRGFEPGAVQRALERGCADLRTGNSGKPTFSRPLMQLLDDAFHDVTLPAERAEIRSADVLDALLRDPSRYHAESFLERHELPSGPRTALPLGDLAKPSTVDPAPSHASVAPVVTQGSSMTRDELVVLLSQRSQVREADVERLMDAWAQVLREALAPDGTGALDWPDVGRFERAEVHVGRVRERVDPFTNETEVIHEGACFVRAAFTPSPGLERVVEPSLLDAAVFDGLFELPWETMTHAYGSAEDVPHHLYLATSPDDEVRAAALQSLADKLYCQGDVFEATGRAVPFLVRIAAAPEIPERASIVAFLAHVSEAASPDPPPAWWGRHREALGEARAQMEALAHDRALAEDAGRFLRALDAGGEEGL